MKPQKELSTKDYVMSFGKYKGHTLDEISDDDPGYVVWLADENILRIEKEFLEAVRKDDMEAVSYSSQWVLQYE